MAVTLATAGFEIEGTPLKGNFGIGFQSAERFVIQLKIDSPIVRGDYSNNKDKSNSTDYGHHAT
jgi:hypothetical protein